MQIFTLNVDQRHAWNRFVSVEPSFGLLQSWEWGEFKEQLGWHVIRLVIQKEKRMVAGAQMLVKPLPMGLASVAYVPRGPVGNWLDEPVASLLLAELCRLAQQHKAIFLKIEPPLLHNSSAAAVLQQHHFIAGKYTNQPQATTIINLEPDEADILKKMRKKTRQNIRRCIKEGIYVRFGACRDLAAFYDLIKITGQRSHFTPRTYDYYEKLWQIFGPKGQMVLLLAFYQDQLLAARTIFRFGDHAAEFHACSANTYRHLHADYLLVWEAVRWAKAQGCCTYDLWGIPDEVGQNIADGKEPLVPTSLNGLWGVYQFKRGFSKNVVAYTSAYDRVFAPPLYKLMESPLNGNLLDQFAVWSDVLGEFKWLDRIKRHG